MLLSCLVFIDKQSSQVSVDRNESSGNEEDTDACRCGIFGSLRFYRRFVLLTCEAPDDVAGKFALFRKVRFWIAARGPYEALMLFLVPLFILKPVKPIGAYLVATGHGVALIIGGEVLKLTIVERIFQATKANNFSIRTNLEFHNLLACISNHLRCGRRR